MPAAIITDGALWGRAFVPWQRRHFRPRDPFGREWAALPGAEEQIAADFGTVAMTVADEDMPDLPPLNVVVTPLKLPDAVMATYRGMARELFATIEGRSIEAASPLIATGKLAQLANGFLYDAGADDPVFVHSLKIDWLRELVEGLDGEPLLIAYEFVEDLRTIRRAFGEVPALGGQTRGARGVAPGRGLERGEAAAARLSSGLGGARAQLAARRVAHGVVVAELVGRAHRAGDRADLPAGADAARDHSRLRRRRHRGRDEAQSGAWQDERAGSVPTASGAGVMQERTAFRLAMLANGYQPLLNDCKQAIETGWPTRIVDEAEVRSWDRSALTSTGLKLDGDLAVIDADVSGRGSRRRLGGRTRQADSPSCSRTASCATPAGPRKRGLRALTSRSGGSPRGAGIAAVIRTIPRCRSIWSNASVRSGRGSLQSTGRMPATERARSSAAMDLPAALRRRRHRGRYCRCCRRRPTGWPAICSTRSPRRQGSPPSRRAGASRGRHAQVFRARRRHRDRDARPRRDDGRRARTPHASAAARGDMPASTLRCSGSFHDRTRVRTDSHLINWGRYGLGIYDTMTETTWHRRERAPSARFEFLGQLQARNPFQ